MSQAGLGSAPAFRVPDYMLTTPFELPLFLVFGILCGAVSAVSTYSNEVAAHPVLVPLPEPRADQSLIP